MLDRVHCQSEDALLQTLCQHTKPVKQKIITLATMIIWLIVWNASFVSQGRTYRHCCYEEAHEQEQSHQRSEELPPGAAERGFRTLLRPGVRRECYFYFLGL